MQTAPVSETSLTLSEATAAVPKLRGKKLHVSTLWRWCRRGCKARNGAIVRLAHRRVGGTLTTTHADLNNFFDALAAADLQSFMADDAPHTAATPKSTPTPKPSPPGTRRAAIARAEAICKKAGI